MKLKLAVVVVLIHCLFLLLFLGPRSCPRLPGLRLGGETPSGAERPGEGEDRPPPPPPPDPGPRYELGTFRDDTVGLPADLDRRVEACRTGVVVDWTAGRLLWAKDEQTAVPIASLTKMMTVLLLMEDIEDRPDISLSTPVKVTVTASDIGGRQVWLDPRETFTLDELLKSVMIRSANDCAFLMGEFLAGGDTAGFVRRMDTRARDMGLTTPVFHNAHGLPADDGSENLGCAVELAFLAGVLLDYDDVVRYSSMRLSYIRENTEPFQLLNTNKLISSCPGVNGMKTGYTSKSGHCLAATCDRGGRVVIVVVTGCSSAAIRNDLVTGLIEWAYTQP